MPKIISTCMLAVKPKNSVNSRRFFPDRGGSCAICTGQAGLTN